MKDSGKDAASSVSLRNSQGRQLAQAIDMVVTPSLFTNVEVHGNTNWSVINLVQITLLWVWSSNRKMVEAANEAIEDGETLFDTQNINSYQTLINGLKRYGNAIQKPLWLRMRGLMEKIDSKRFRTGRWVVLAVDGSRVSACRTAANELRFCKPKKKAGKKQKSKKQKSKKNKRGRQAKKRKPVSKKTHYNPQPVGPQTWLTMIWHVGQQMPWAWKIGPSYSSERAHVLELLESQEFPKDTLICGDAGFVGYDFWKSINEKDHRFLMRVGSNCNFLKKLGRVREREGIVYCWPKDKQARKQPPIALRLLHFHDGRGDMYLVTNELNESKLTAAECKEIYRQRWGIELQFRGLKQTFDRSKLQGRTPDVVEQELTWSIVGLWMLQLLALRDQVDVLEPDRKTSIAMVISIVQKILRRPERVTRGTETLRGQLSRAITDGYDRTGNKKSRNYPRRKEEPRSGPPNITRATAAQVRLAATIESLKNAV